jgi:hypothetical protein
MIQLKTQLAPDALLKATSLSDRSSHPRIMCADLLSPAIALLSNREIDSMDRDDLKDAVRIATSRHPAARASQNFNLDDTQLRRLLYLLRRMLRVQMDKTVEAHGVQPYFREVI